jgi:hypothetical protein
VGIKYAVNERFFEAWSPEMAYVLGYIYADGSLVYDPISRGSYVGITSTDPDILFAIRTVLSSEHKIRREIPHGNRKIKFALRIGNVALYKSLTKHGLYQNKSLTITFPKVPQDYLFDFTRGYFDGDGCVHLERAQGKTQLIIVKRLSVIFTSGSKKFLEGLSENITNQIGIKGHIYKGQRAFQLRFFTSASIALFCEMYSRVPANLLLVRKLDKFSAYFNLRSRRVDEKTKSVLESFGRT